MKIHASSIFSHAQPLTTNFHPLSGLIATPGNSSKYPGLAASSPTVPRLENPQANLRLAGALAGDTVEVLPSDRFPVDGVILDGRTAADESSLTGVCVCVRQIGLRPRPILFFFVADCDKRR